VQTSDYWVGSEQSDFHYSLLKQTQAMVMITYDEAPSTRDRHHHHGIIIITTTIFVLVSDLALNKQKITSGKSPVYINPTALLI